MAIERIQSQLTTQPVPLSQVAGKGAAAIADAAGSIAQQSAQIGDIQQQKQQTAEKYLTTNDILLTTNGMKSKYSQNFEGQQSVDKADAAYKSYASQTLSRTSGANKPYISSVLAQNYVNLTNTLDTKNYQYNMTESQLALNDTYNNMNQAMQNSARKAGSINSSDPQKNPLIAEPMTLHAGIKDMAQKAALTGVISAQAANRMINDSTDQLHMQYVLGQYEHAKQLQQQDPEKNIDAPKNIIKKFNEGQYQDLLREDQTKTVLAGFKSIDEQYKYASGMTAANLSNQISNIKNNLLVNGQADSQVYSNVISASGAKAEQLESSFNAYRNVHAEIKSASGSIDELSALQQQLALPLTSSEAASKNSTQIAEAKKAGSQYLSGLLTQAKQNPAVLSQISPDVQKQVENTLVDPQYVNQKDPTQKQDYLFSSISLANVAKQKQWNIPDGQISALSDSQASQLSNRIMTTPDSNTGQLNPAVQAQNLVNTINDYPKAIQPYVLRSLNKYLPQASQYLLNMDASQKFNSLTPLMAQAYAKKVDDFKPLMQTKGLTQSKIVQAISSTPSYQHEQAYLQSMGGDPTAEMNKFTDHAVLGTLQLMQSKGLDVNKAAATTTSAQIGDAEFHSFMMNGSTIKTPSDLNTTDLHLTMNYLMDKASKDGVNLNPYVVNQYPQGSDEKTMEGLTLNGSSFANNKNNNGIVLLDESGSVVKDKNGKPVGVTFADMKDPQFQTQVVQPYMRNLAIATLGKAKNLSDIQSYLRKNEGRLTSQHITLPQLVQFETKKSGRFGAFVDPFKEKKTLGENLSLEFGGETT